MVNQHIHKVRIYYQDTDAGGVTYHACYANFAERARCEFLRDNGESVVELQQKDGIILVVRSLNLEFLQPTYLDEEITIHSFVTHIGKASFRMRQEFSRQQDKICVADVGLVCVAKKQDRFQPHGLPQSLQNILTNYHH